MHQTSIQSIIDSNSNSNSNSLNTQPLPLSHNWDLHEDLLSPSAPLLLSVLEPPIGMAVSSSTTCSPPSIPGPKTITRRTERSLTQDMTHTTSEESPQQCLVDFVEWWCHKLLTATTSVEVETAETELLQALENFGTSPPEFGRLANRIQLAAFSLDVAVFARRKSALSPQEHWGFLKEELILWKSKLLRKDANADVAFLHTAEERQGWQEATPDFQREQSPLFQERYQQVLRGVQVQYNLALFQSKLQELVEDTTSTSSAENKKLVRAAIEEYETNIHTLFIPATATTTQEENGDDNDEEEEEKEEEKNTSSHMPQELTGFLLKDLYQTSHKNNNNNNSSGAASPSSTGSQDSSSAASTLAQRLLSHVQSIVQGTSKHTSNYSQASCQQQLRQLLQDWHHHVLDAPTLVQLGYGATSESSAPSAKKAIAEEDAMLRRLSSSEPIDQEAVLAIIEDPFDNYHNNDTKKRKPSFIPVAWVDSDEEKLYEPPPEEDLDDNDDDEEPLPTTSSTIERRRKKHRTTQPDNPKYPNLTLYSDSDEDPLEAPVTGKFIAATQAAALKRKQKKRRSAPTPTMTTSSSLSPTTTTTPPRIKVSTAEAAAIQEGVRKYGLGRWKIIQQQANGKLDKLSTQTIKLAYQQIQLKKKKKRRKSLESSSAATTM